MIAEKNGITVDTRTAAPARKMIKCPQKTGINLNLQEDRQRDRRTLLIGILAIAALVTVVVNFGVLQQYGTPAEVYDDPVNEFVASFIGDPPMNILETTTVKIDNDFFFTFKDSDLKIAVPKRYYSVVSDGFRCKMGVRPMDVLVGGADSQGTPEKITTFENLGDERRIGISVGESLLMLIPSDETRYHAGDVIKLEVRGDKTHLFDLETGARIKEK